MMNYQQPFQRPQQRPSILAMRAMRPQMPMQGGTPPSVSPGEGYQVSTPPPDQFMGAGPMQQPAQWPPFQSKAPMPGGGLQTTTPPADQFMGAAPGQTDYRVGFGSSDGQSFWAMAPNQYAGGIPNSAAAAYLYLQSLGLPWAAGGPPGMQMNQPNYNPPSGMR